MQIVRGVVSETPLNTRVCEAATVSVGGAPAGQAVGHVHEIVGGSFTANGEQAWLRAAKLRPTIAASNGHVASIKPRQIKLVGGSTLQPGQPTMIFDPLISVDGGACLGDAGRDRKFSSTSNAH